MIDQMNLSGTAQGDIARHLDGSSVVLVGPIGDFTHLVTPEERAFVRQARRVRVREFATARYLAKLAQLDLGLQPQSVLKNGRRPVWPKGLQGSITHSPTLAGCAVTRDGTILGLGLDLEKNGRIDPNLYRMLFTCGERALLRGDGVSGLADLPTALFSAKEAVFKAVNPTVGLMIDYCEVSIRVHLSGRAFRAEYHGKDTANSIMHSGIGWIRQFADHTLTLFSVPTID